MHLHLLNILSSLAEVVAAELRAAAVAQADLELQQVLVLRLGLQLP